MFTRNKTLIQITQARLYSLRLYTGYKLEYAGYIAKHYIGTRG